MKKIIAYIRISDRGEDEKESIPKQIEQIKGWVAYRGLPNDIEILQDVKVSGYSRTRKGFRELIEKLKTGEYSHLIIRDCSRLVRSVEIGSWFLNNILKKYNISLVSLNESLDTSTAAGKFFFHMLLAKDQYYRDEVSERSLKAIERKRSKGQSISGHAPYGFIYTEDKKVIKDEEEQKIIKIIKDLKSKGKTYSEIRRELRDRRIPSPGGEVWHLSTVRRIYLRGA